MGFLLSGILSLASGIILLILYPRMMAEYPKWLQRQARFMAIRGLPVKPKRTRISAAWISEKAIMMKAKLSRLWMIVVSRFPTRATIFQKSPKHLAAPVDKPQATKAIEPESLEKFNIARSIISADIIRRTNEQTINFPMFALGVTFLIILPFLWLRAVNNKSIQKQNAIATRKANTEYSYGVPTARGFVVDSPLTAPTSTPPPVYTPYVFDLPIPPTVTPTPAPQIIEWAYSYYYPALGGINCKDWKKNKCVSTTSSGAPWEDWLGRGIAIHPSLLEMYPYGTVFQVVSPSELAGLYTVVDLCTGCKKPDYPAVTWVDFLDTTQRAGWSEPVQLQMVYKP